MRFLKILAQKVIAANLLFFFFANTVLGSVPSTGLLIPERLRELSAGLNPLELPAGMVTVVRQSDSGTAPVIIHIQDAHANEEAQLRIREVLKELTQHHHIRLIGLEGLAGNLRPESFRVFPEKEANAAVARQLVKEGELTGAEFFAIENEDAGVEWLGLEDKNVYRRDLELFQNVLAKWASAEPDFRNAENTLRQAKTGIFSKPLLSFDEKACAFQKREIGLLQYARLLKRKSARILGKDLADSKNQREFPNFVRVMLLSRAEQKLKTRAPQIKQEREKLAALLKQARLEDRDFAVGVLARLDGSKWPLELAPRYFFEMLYGLCREAGINLQDFPAFREYAEFFILQSEMEAGGLFREIGLIESEIYGKLIWTGEEKKLFDLHKRLGLAEKFLQLEVSREEYDKLKSRQSDFMPSRIFSEINQFNKTEAAAGSNSMDALFAEADGFYRLAGEREQFFVDRLLDAMRAKKLKQAVLISGGFHSAGIQHLLDQKGIASVTLAPRISGEGDPSVYHRVILNGKTWLDEQIETRATASQSKIVAALETQDSLTYGFVNPGGAWRPYRSLAGAVLQAGISVILRLRGRDMSTASFQPESLLAGGTIQIKSTSSDFQISAELPTPQGIVAARGKLSITAPYAPMGAFTVISQELVQAASLGKEIRRVLIVDDYTDNLPVLVETVQALLLGVETVDTANDGEEGWQKFQERAYDLVLTDLQMPRLDGAGLAARINPPGRAETVPVILATTRLRENETLLDGLVESGQIFVALEKPYGFRELAQVFEKIQGQPEGQSLGWDERETGPTSRRISDAIHLYFFGKDEETVKAARGVLIKALRKHDLGASFNFDIGLSAEGNQKRRLNALLEARRYFRNLKRDLFPESSAENPEFTFNVLRERMYAGMGIGPAASSKRIELIESTPENRQMVPVDSLIPQQPRVYSKELFTRELFHDQIESAPVLVLQTDDGKRFLLDGHHRAVTALRAGETKIEAHIIKAAGLRPENIPGDYELPLWRALTSYRVSGSQEDLQNAEAVDSLGAMILKLPAAAGESFEFFQIKDLPRRAYTPPHAASLGSRPEARKTLAGWHEHFEAMRKAAAGLMDEDKLKVRLSVRGASGDVTKEEIEIPYSRLTNQKRVLAYYLAILIANRGVLTGATEVGLEVSRSPRGHDLAKELSRESRRILHEFFGKTITFATFGKGFKFNFKNPRLEGKVLAGRTTTLPSADYSKGEAVGFDLGGTNLKIAFVRNGEALLTEAVPLQDIKEPLGTFIKKKIRAIGEQFDTDLSGKAVYVTIPGPVTPEGKIITITNLEQSRPGTTDSLNALQNELGSIRFQNDANTAAFYQMVKAGLTGNVILNTLGTGLGLGIIINGSLIPGPQEAHLRIYFDSAAHYHEGFQMSGDLESYANAEFVVRRAAELIQKPRRKKIVPPAGALTPAVVASWLSGQNGDSLKTIAEQVYAEFGQHLALLYQEIARVTGIQEWTVVLVGGIAGGNTGKTIIESVLAAAAEKTPGLKLNLLVGEEAQYTGAFGSAYLSLQAQQVEAASLGGAETIKGFDLLAESAQKAVELYERIPLMARGTGDFNLLQFVVLQAVHKVVRFARKLADEKHTDWLESDFTAQDFKSLLTQTVDLIPEQVLHENEEATIPVIYRGPHNTQIMVAGQSFAPVYYLIRYRDDQVTEMGIEARELFSSGEKYVLAPGAYPLRWIAMEPGKGGQAKLRPLFDGEEVLHLRELLKPVLTMPETDRQSIKDLRLIAEYLDLLYDENGIKKYSSEAQSLGVSEFDEKLLEIGRIFKDAPEAAAELTALIASAQQSEIEMAGKSLSPQVKAGDVFLVLKPMKDAKQQPVPPVFKLHQIKADSYIGHSIFRDRDVFEIPAANFRNRVIRNEIKMLTAQSLGTEEPVQPAGLSLKKGDHLKIDGKDVAQIRSTRVLEGGKQVIEIFVGSRVGLSLKMLLELLSIPRRSVIGVWLEPATGTKKPTGPPKQNDVLPAGKVMTLAVDLNQYRDTMQTLFRAINTRMIPLIQKELNDPDITAANLAQHVYIEIQPSRTKKDTFYFHFTHVNQKDQFLEGVGKRTEAIDASRGSWFVLVEELIWDLMAAGTPETVKDVLENTDFAARISALSAAAQTVQASSLGQLEQAADGRLAVQALASGLGQEKVLIPIDDERGVHPLVSMAVKYIQTFQNVAKTKGTPDHPVMEDQTGLEWYADVSPDGHDIYFEYDGGRQLILSDLMDEAKIKKVFGASFQSLAPAGEQTETPVAYYYDGAKPAILEFDRTINSVSAVYIPLDSAQQQYLKLEILDRRSGRERPYDTRNDIFDYDKQGPVVVPIVKLEYAKSFADVRAQATLVEGDRLRHAMQTAGPVKINAQSLGLSEEGAVFFTGIRRVLIAEPDAGKRNSLKERVIAWMQHRGLENYSIEESENDGTASTRYESALREGRPFDFLIGGNGLRESVFKLRPVPVVSADGILASFNANEFLDRYENSASQTIPLYLMSDDGEIFDIGYAKEWIFPHGNHDPPYNGETITISHQGQRVGFIDFVAGSIEYSHKSYQVQDGREPAIQVDGQYAARYSGIQESLISMAMRIAQSQGIATFYSVHQNPAARDFYRRIGMFGEDSEGATFRFPLDPNEMLELGINFPSLKLIKTKLESISPEAQSLGQLGQAADGRPETQALASGMGRAREILHGQGRGLDDVTGAIEVFAGRMIGPWEKPEVKQFLLGIYAPVETAAPDSGAPSALKTGLIEYGTQRRSSGGPDVYTEAYNGAGKFAILAATSRDISVEAVERQLILNPLARVVVAAIQDPAFEARLKQRLGGLMARVDLRAVQTEEEVAIFFNTLLKGPYLEKMRDFYRADLNQRDLARHIVFLAGESVLAGLDASLASRLLVPDAQEIGSMDREAVKTYHNSLGYLLAREGGDFDELSRQIPDVRNALNPSGLEFRLNLTGLAERVSELYAEFQGFMQMAQAA